MYGDIFNCLEVFLNDVEFYDYLVVKKIENRYLVLYIRFICIVLNILFEVGVKIVVEELDEFMVLDVNFNFDFVKENNFDFDNF